MIFLARTLYNAGKRVRHNTGRPKYSKLNKNHLNDMSTAMFEETNLPVETTKKKMKENS